MIVVTVPLPLQAMFNSLSSKPNFALEKGRKQRTPGLESAIESALRGLDLMMERHLNCVLISFATVAKHIMKEILSLLSRTPRSLWCMIVV